MIHGLLCANQLTTMGIEATSRNSAIEDCDGLLKSLLVRAAGMSAFKLFEPSLSAIVHTSPSTLNHYFSGSSRAQW